MRHRVPAAVGAARRRAADTVERLASTDQTADGVLTQRVDELVAALRAEPGVVPTGQGDRDVVLAALRAGSDRLTWLVLAVLGGALPDAAAVVATRRQVTVQGAPPALDRVLREARSAVVRSGRGHDEPPVRVLRDAVLVDLEHTSRTELATGIQRVARQTAARWARDHDVELVGWTTDGRSLRRLSGPEAARALTGHSVGAQAAAGPTEVVVPLGGTYLLPELVTEEPRQQRLAALARFAGMVTGVVGFDCVPLTSAETTAEAMGGAFAGNLAAVRHFTRVGAISRAAAAEYAGWRRMCRAAGWPGPDVAAVSLPAEPGPCSPEARERFVARTGSVSTLPFVLVVGSHEPRKNHVALLHAAERLWREDLRFAMLFVGGNAWNSSDFDDAVRAARDADRPVHTLRGLPDDELWAAYRMARCVAFPSLNEGFGLPVAEALSVGTPVLTSAFGSMAEIAADGGALLVDPRDDEDVLDGLRALLVDRGLQETLRADAAVRPVRTWDQYAEQLWQLLVEGHGTATRR